MVAPTVAPQIHLAEEGGVLVLREGPSPIPAKEPQSRILIIGGGVTGLTNAWAFLDAGYAVTVVSDQWASLENRITSQIAGALWEWPPAVCGRHTDIISLNLSKGWCMTSYNVLEKLQKILPVEAHGIRMRTANFFFDRPIEENEEEYNKMREIEAAKIHGFEHDPTLVKKHEISRTAAVVDAYKHTSPVIDTDVYMLWLRSVVGAKGGKFVTRHVSGDLLEHEDELLQEYEANVLINCTGLGAYDLAQDKSVHPLRGALIRIVNDGSRFPVVKEALIVAYDQDKRDDDGGIVFIVPRNDRVLILGGIAQANEGALDLTLDSPEMRRMRDRCNKFVPGLENAELDPDSIVQGLRPLRGGNVRLERELRRKSDRSLSKVVHSYGHGGSGFTLSFGCAGDVLKLVREVEAGTPPVAMSIAE
ncbi:hypothetical protein NM688_g5711 [Phlebia brevispora]|uniref:Uncharacterized protein n=1 Tax=Phlebia brevispora TaxID=194682 RepID=A0ACC1SR43_9APHY|nr:hypothetical protein NM688_g5711 [Phlebia brevispora]